MTTMIIPKQFAGKDDLVLIPKKEYEALLVLQKSISEFISTPTQKKALTKAREELKLGKTLSYNDIVEKLGFAN